MTDTDPPPARLKIILAFIFTLVAGSSLLWIEQFLRTPVAELGIVSFELAKGPGRVTEILTAWGTGGQFWAGWSLIIDYPFLVAYTILFTELTKLTTSEFKQLFSIGFLMAGMCDAVENFALLALLNGLTAPQLSAAAYYFASLKFLLLGAGGIYLVTQLILFLVAKLSNSGKTKGHEDDNAANDSARRGV